MPSTQIEASVRNVIRLLIEKAREGFRETIDWCAFNKEKDLRCVDMSTQSKTASRWCHSCPSESPSREQLKGVRNFFKIVSLPSSPGLPNPSCPRLSHPSPAHSLCLFHFNSFRWSSIAARLCLLYLSYSPPFKFAIERIYIDYNVKIRQIDKIDKSILMAIQQRKIYIFHWAPGWSSVFPMLSCFDVSSDCAPDFFQLNSSLICVSILKKRDTAAATALLHNR